MIPLLCGDWGGDIIYKVWYFIDNFYVGYYEFYSTLLINCSTPYELYSSLNELTLYNQCNVNGHYFKIKKVYEGG